MAEAAELLQDWRLEEATLYVTLEPCPMCAGAIVQARVERLVYGTANLKAGSAGTILDLMNVAGFNHRVAVTNGVLAAECTALLKRFFQNLRQEKAKGYPPRELAPEFFRASAKELAPRLIGKLLCRRLANGEILRYRITETECYYGEKDTACHAHKGRTARTERYPLPVSCGWKRTGQKPRSVATGELGLLMPAPRTGNENGDLSGKNRRILNIKKV